MGLGKTLKQKPQPGLDLIKQQIKALGPMRFDHFVDLALYHPQYGYYNRKSPQRGLAGDYFTSLQVSTLFPEIMADVFIQMKEELGTEQFHLIEVGSGGGELLEGVLKALEKKKKHKGFHVWSVEKSRTARDHLWRRLSRFSKCQVVSSLSEIEMVGGVEGCIFSNEFFDAIPFQRLKLRNKKWYEVWLDLKENQLVEIDRPFQDAAVISDLERQDLQWADEQEIEWRGNLSSLWNEWGSLLTRGFVLTFDYGYPRFQLYDPRRKNGTWLCYHKHQTNQEPLERIGDQDITAHIDFTQLADLGKSQGFDPVLFCSQGLFLTHLGESCIQTFLSEGDETQKRKRAAAVAQLLHPEAMGEAFWVLVQTKEVSTPSTFRPIPNRLRRLM